MTLGDSKWLGRSTKLVRSDHVRSGPPSRTPRSKRVGTTWAIEQVIEQAIELGIFGKGSLSVSDDDPEGVNLPSTFVGINLHMNQG